MIPLSKGTTLLPARKPGLVTRFLHRAQPRSGLPYFPWYIGYLYLLPGMVIYFVFVILPLLDSLRISFFKWDGLNPAVFSGLSNYLRLFSNPDFLTALSHNFYFVIFNSLLPILFGLGITAILTRHILPGMPFFRVVLFLPQVIPITVIGVVWSWTLSPVNGPVNLLLKEIGLSSWAVPWLGSFVFARPAVGLVSTWMMVGFCMVLFIAGAQQISVDLYDAVEIDGANEFQQFLAVTFPGLRSELGVALVTTLIDSMRMFGLIFVMTRGGPGRETNVIAYQLYNAAFVEHSVGYGAAIAIVLTVLIVALSTGALAFQRRLMRE
jgi:raffinose/stachyose/melibiose transport system permease protein